MEGVPERLEPGLVRALGGYLRDVATPELPAALRRYQKLRDRALLQHKAVLLEALEDEDLRVDVLEWLDEAKPRLKDPEGRILRLVAERPEGWEAELGGLSPQESSTDRSDDRYRKLEAKLEREQEKTRRAREDARKAREEARDAAGRSRARLAELEASLTQARDEAAAERSRARDALAEAEEAGKRLARELKRAEKQVAEARSDQDRARSEMKASRREVRNLVKRIAELEGQAASLRRDLQTAADTRPGPEPVDVPTSPKQRRPLPVPQGLVEEAPQTLEEWLSHDGVELLIDGYNVVLAEDGYGGGDLEGRRDRLVQDVSRLAIRTGSDAIVVFDGSTVPPGTKRMRRGPVRVEYSRPDEIADDHLVALLGDLPPAPVIVATNDRELQDRARGLGATVATSNQLLELLK